MERIPAYRKMYTALKRDIQDGRYKPGILLPTEAELEEQFLVSRTTVRKAISMLAAEGYLSVRQGRGTEVLDVSTTQKLNGISSITETLTAKGHTVTTQVMCIEALPAPDFVQDALSLPPKNRLVYKVQRVQCADGLPIAMVVNYLVASQVPNLDKYVNTFSGLYLFLERQYDIKLTSGWEFISAISADFIESQILHIPMGAPLLYTKRITHTALGPLEYGTSKLVADKYEYSVYLDGRVLNGETGLAK